MVEDDHLLADLPLVVLHVVPVQDGQRHHQGGGDGQEGDKDRTDVSRYQTENNYLEFTRSSKSEHFFKKNWMVDLRQPLVREHVTE